LRLWGVIQVLYGLEVFGEGGRVFFIGFDDGHVLGLIGLALKFTAGC
jgi:hypothetical protein